VKRPNFFIFMLDTQRHVNMSCYGYHRPTTPNIDRIGAEGVVFENHFTNSVWSLPSQTSLFTGKYLSGHGCGVCYQFLEDGIPTLAEALNDTGYLTAAINPNPWVQQDSGNCGRGFQEYLNPRKMEDVPPYTKKEAGESYGPSWKLVGLVEKWLDDHKDDKRPWLLFVLTAEPHMKYWAPQPFRKRFLLPGVDDEYAGKIPQNQFSGTAGEVVLSEKEWEIVRSLRDGATACVDDRIGRIYDNMRKRGILDDTVFIVTSDHGDTQGEHGFHTAHCQTAIWDTLLHTPLVIRYPDGFPGGVRVEHIVQTVDVMPTLLEMAGVTDENVWNEMHGKSLLQTVKGKPIREFAVAETQKPLEPFHWIMREHPGYDIRVFNRHLKCARTLEWKYIWASDGQDHLYHVAVDPDEQKNLIREKKEIADELRLKLENFLLSIDRRDFGDCLKLTGHVKVDPDIARRLQAWGLYRRIIGAPRQE